MRSILQLNEEPKDPQSAADSLSEPGQPIPHAPASTPATTIQTSSSPTSAKRRTPLGLNLFDYEIDHATLAPEQPDSGPAAPIGSGETKAPESVNGSTTTAHGATANGVSHETARERTPDTTHEASVDAAADSSQQLSGGFFGGLMVEREAQVSTAEMFRLELGGRLPAVRNLATSLLLHASVITLIMTVRIPAPPLEIARNDANPTEIRIGNHLYYVAQISSAEKDRPPSKIELPPGAYAGKAGAPARVRPAPKEPAPSAAPEPAPAIKLAAPAPPAAVQAAADAAAEDARTQAAKAAARKALARTFIPPEVKRSPLATQTLIQPMSPPDLVPPPTPLPSFRVMTPQFPRLNRRFVAPGRPVERPPAQTPTVAAPDFQVVQAEPVAVDLQPKLPLPAAPPPPEQAKTAPEGPAPSPKGEPLNILSLSDRNIPLNDRVVVPAGNIAQEAGAAAAPSTGTAGGATRASTGASPASSNAASASGAGSSAIGSGPANSRGTSTAPSLANTAPGGSGLGNAPVARPGAGAGAGTSVAAGTGNGANTNGVGTSADGNGNSNAGSGNGSALAGGSTTGGPTAIVGGPGSGAGAGGNSSGTGQGTATAGANGASNTGPTAPGQTINRSPTGTFDAVVVQSSPLDQYPESRGLLTGRPIYSVYIPVGAARDWTLYYCIPNERPTQESSRVVQLSAAQPAPIKAPYPFKMTRPQAALPSWAKYVLVHGYVNAQGHFEGMKVVRSVLPDIDRAILTSLGDWEFRAAVRDGSPVMVEVLLSIPAKGL